MEASFLELFGDLSEDFYTELKAAQGRDGKGEFPKSAWESYSAFGNTEGGRIILGVSDTGEIIGIENTQKVLNEIWNSLSNPQIVSENLLSNDDIEIISAPNGREIIVITVPSATRHQRPVFVKGNPITGTYIRKFEGDYKATPNIVKRMLADQMDQAADCQVIKNVFLSDLDSETISQYRNLFKSSSPDHPFLSGSDEELLRAVGAMKINRETSRYELTVAGLLVFGDLVLINETFPFFSLDYQEKSDENPRWIDRVSTDGTWTGNLFQFYRKIFPRLTEQLKIPFFLDENQTRIDTTQIHKALREALVNTLIHSDYRGTISIMITKYHNRFEFRNPGRLRITKEQFFQGDTSDCRNPAIQNIFRMIGAGEKAGSGGLLIRQAWDNRDWKKPVVEQDFERDVTTLFLPLENLWGPSVFEELKHQFPDFLTLNMDEKTILAIALSEGIISSFVLLDHLQLDQRKIKLMLRKLVRAGYLVKDFSHRGWGYHLPQQFDLFHNSNSGNKDPNSGNKDSNSGNKDSNSGNKDSNSGNKDSNSGNKDSNSGNKDSNFNHEALKRIASAIAETKRANTQDIEKTILQLCALKPLSLAELSEYLRRSKRRIRQYVKPMLGDQRLRLLYPDIINHPQQAYIFDN